jgi:predicted nucleic acid-binding protein
MKPMPDKVFLDSNIIIYAYSIDEPKKQNIVKDLLNAHETIIISTQTINEFVTVTTRKKILNTMQVSAVVDELFSVFLVETINQNVIQKAIALAKKYRYSYFDCLMLASAHTSGCSTLYSEDMHHSHIVENSLKIINPF